MSRSSAAYLEMFLGLLPPGQAWTRERYSVLARLLGVFASEFDRVDGRAAALIDESDPRATREMLSDWEVVAGLPDACSGLAGTATERRAALTLKITGIGGQSRAYFQAIADRLGYDVQIREYRPFICGLSRCAADPLNGGHEVRHTWTVTVYGPRVTRFRVGQSRCAEKLLSIVAAQDLECVLRRLKPAHTHLVFAYDAQPRKIPVSVSGQIPVSESGQIPVSG